MSMRVAPARRRSEAGARVSRGSSISLGSPLPVAPGSPVESPSSGVPVPTAVPDAALPSRAAVIEEVDAEAPGTRPAARLSRPPGLGSTGAALPV